MRRTYALSAGSKSRRKSLDLLKLSYSLLIHRPSTGWSRDTLLEGRFHRLVLLAEQLDGEVVHHGVLREVRGQILHRAVVAVVEEDPGLRPPHLGRDVVEADGAGGGAPPLPDAVA